MPALFFSAVSVAAVAIAAAGLAALGLGLRRGWQAARTPGLAPGPRHGGGQRAGGRRPSPIAGPGGAVLTLYRAQVRYRYPGPGGQVLHGDRVGLEDAAVSAPGPARAVLERYPPGAAVTVFHHPRDPAQAVLEPGIPGASALLPAVGVGLLVLAAGMWAIVRRWSGV